MNNVSLLHPNDNDGISNISEQQQQQCEPRHESSQNEHHHQKQLCSTSLTRKERRRFKKILKRTATCTTSSTSSLNHSNDQHHHHANSTTHHVVKEITTPINKNSSISSKHSKRQKKRRLRHHDGDHNNSNNNNESITNKDNKNKDNINNNQIDHNHNKTSNSIDNNNNNEHQDQSMNHNLGKATGIVSYEQYGELQSLLHASACENRTTTNSSHKMMMVLPYMSMNMCGNRKQHQHNQNNNKVIEGNNHRNLLYYLITNSLVTDKYYSNNSNNRNNTNNHNHQLAQNQHQDQQQLAKNEEKNHGKRQHSSLLPIHIPSWITIQNPMMVQHVVMIELNIEYIRNNYHNTSLSTSSSSSSLSKTTATVNEHNNNNNVTIIDPDIVNHINKRFRHIFQHKENKEVTKHDIATTIRTLEIKTRWYQGFKPKSISDTCMYTFRMPATPTKNTNKSDNKRQKNEADASTNSIANSDEKMNGSNEHNTSTKLLRSHDMYALLQPFILTKDQLIKEGYPICRCLHSHTIRKQVETIIESTSSSSTMHHDNKSNESILSSQDKAHISSTTSNSGTSSIVVPSLQDAISYIGKYQTSIIQTDSVSPNSQNYHFNCTDHRPPYVVLPSPIQHEEEKSSSSVPQCSGSDRHDGNSNYNNHRIYAMDCEMVVTKYGSELARITLMQLKEVVIQSRKTKNTTPNHNKTIHTTGPVVQKDDDDDGKYDSKQIISPDDDKKDEIQIHPILVFDYIVKPKNEIVDYVTQYSGITFEMLHRSNVLQLEQIQAIILQLIRPNDIIIGHSLENDLHVIRYIHSRVIDTSVLFRTEDQSFKFSLRHLSAVLLKKHIQLINQPHCSEIDAITTLELTIYRAIIGPSFAITTRNRNHSNCFNNLAELTKTKGMKALCIGPIQWLKEHVLHNHHNHRATIGTAPNSVHALQCESIHDPNAKAIKAWLNSSNGTRKADLVWANFVLPVNPKSIITAATTATNLAAIDREIDVYEKYFHELFRIVPPRNTVLCIGIQHGLKHAKELYQLKMTKQNNRATIGWSNDDETSYQNANNICQNGLVFWITTHPSK